MERLVYSPKVHAFVKTSDGTVIDLSQYLVNGQVVRQTGNVSTASLTLRNSTILRDSKIPNRTVGEFLFTQRGKPTFHPMDAITIFMTRIINKPIQVFTGYLDDTPFLSLWPGTITLQASCTMKRLLYTYWDPALPFVRDFMSKFGWAPGPNDGQLTNPAALTQALNSAGANINDGSFGKLLFAILKEVGHWDPSTILIEELPAGLRTKMQRIYNDLLPGEQAAHATIDSFFGKLIGSSSQGGGGSTGGGAGSNGGVESGTTGAVTGAGQIVPILVQNANAHGIPPLFVVTVAISESSLNPTETSPGQGTSDGDVGLFQESTTATNNPPYGKWGIQTIPTVAQAEDVGYSSALFCRAAAAFAQQTKFDWTNQGGWEQAATTLQGSVGYPSWAGNQQLAQTYISQFGNRSGSAGLPDNSAVGAAPNHPTSTSTGSSSSSPGGTTRLDAIIAEANRLAKQNLHYTNVRIDTGPATSHKQDSIGYDCSATVSELLFAGGYAVTEWFDTSSFLSLPFIKSGADPSGKFTIWDDDSPGSGAGNNFHMYATINGTDFSTGYTNNPNGGPGWNPQSRAGFKPYHVDGLDQPASVPAGADTSTGGAGSPTGSNANAGNSSVASAFAAFLDFPTIEQTVEAAALTGRKSLMNDQPLLPFVEQISTACMRTFQSMPNGNFWAFFPDYFGGFGRSPYWQVHPMEIIDGGFNLSDKTFATHVYVVGDTIPTVTDELVLKLNSGGVVTIDDAFRLDFLGIGDANALVDPLTGHSQSAGNGTGHTKVIKGGPKGTGKQTDGITPHNADALRIMTKYGARPYLEEAPMIRSPYFEAFLALQRFLQLWSSQFNSKFQFTFMPELFPGGLISIPEYNIQCYVESVTHSFDYEGGFVTEAVLSSPASLDKSDHLTAGMIPANVLATVPVPNREQKAR